MAESIQNDEEPADPYEVPVLALRTKTTCKISSLLNPVKVIPTESGIPRDWHGLADLIGIGGEDMPHLQSNPDPTMKLLQMWSEQKKDSGTISNLIKLLETIDRFDVIDDVMDLIDLDIKLYNEKPACKEVVKLNADSDQNVLTVDDINRINQGLDPQKYDAFLLFAEEDIHFATELIEMLEKQRNLKLCVKDRDLVGGAFEHEAIIRLIAERCNRLVMVISPAFFASAANKFYTSFAAAIGIAERRRKLVPCIYTHCEIPVTLNYYYKLDYTRNSKFCNFWDTLYNAIRTPEQEPPKKSNLNRSVSHQIRSNIKINNVRPAIRQNGYSSLKPKKEGVSFSSMVNLSKTKDQPQLNSSTSLNAVPLEEKKAKPKTNWIRKILHVSRSNSKGDSLKEKSAKTKKNFWQRHSKQKVAVAN